MAKAVLVPLTGGAYQAQNLIANAQRCINLYPEQTPQEQEPPVPVTHFLTPGLTTLAEGIPTTVRGLWQTTDGTKAYAVIGQNVYYVARDWSLTLLGQLVTNLTTPVSMVDDGDVVTIVDGSPFGYRITIASNTMAQIVDPTGTFVGATKVDYLDTFTLFNDPNSGTFYCTRPASLDFDGLYQAVKSAWPDPMQTFIVDHKEVWLLGRQKTEIWFDAGNPLFPFAPLPGAFVEHGTVARYSVASSDVAIFWLSRDLQGQCIVLRGNQYNAKRISTFAIEAHFQTLPRVDDAIGFTQQTAGHTFYWLVLPSAGETWCYDEATEQWHQRVSLDNNGNIGRHRANCFGLLYGTPVVGDYQNGKLYQLDTTNQTDDGMPIPRIRSWPYLVDTGNRVKFEAFIAYIGCGQIKNDNPDHSLTLRYSDDGGQTWSNGIERSLGATGRYETQCYFANLGQARTRVFELSWSSPTPTGLNGAWVQARRMVS